MEQQSNLIIFQVIGTGTSFYLTFFINDLKNRLAVKVARFAADRKLKAKPARRSYRNVLW